MVDFSLLKPTMLADVVGIILIVVVVIVAFVLLWLDYRHYIENMAKESFALSSLSRMRDSICFSC